MDGRSDPQHKFSRPVDQLHLPVHLSSKLRCMLMEASVSQTVLRIFEALVRIVPARGTRSGSAIGSSVRVRLALRRGRSARQPFSGCFPILLIRRSRRLWATFFFQVAPDCLSCFLFCSCLFWQCASMCTPICFLRVGFPRVFLCVPRWCI